MLRVGFISYLNAFPFYFPFAKMSPEECLDWQFTIERPGVLNRMLKENELDISLVSFMEYASRPAKYQIIRGIGLSSKGYVDSVKLLSKVPMEELKACEIRTSNASATSVSAMEILLRECGVDNYTCSPYDVTEGIPDCLAALTIGDEALTAETSHFDYSYDLGEIWQQRFKRNIVFAVCAVRKEAVDWKLTSLSSFVTELQKAPLYCQSNRREFEQACRQRYPEISAPMSYLHRLRFQMETQEEDDILFFLKKAWEYKLISKEVVPEYFSPPLQLATGEVL